LKRGEQSHQEIEQRAYEKLKILGVHEQALKRSSKLSGGQQQRVAIARALINDPDIIMGDEPTGNLDTYNSDVVFNIFSELTHTYKQTIIAVTHDEECARKSDRIVEMSDGRVVR
jgi:lipoprotein-releasing system ATP-binding protein